MIARIRELLDVVRALVRRPAAPVAPRGDDPDLQAGSRGIPAERKQATCPLCQKPAESVSVQLGGQSVAVIGCPCVGERAFEIVMHDPALPPGLAPCPICATMQQPREGHMAVHFASARDQRPCVGSWPARKVGA